MVEKSSAMHAGYASSDILERVTGRKIYSTKEFVPQLERTVSEPEPYFNANAVHSRWNKFSNLRSRRCQKNPRALSASQVVYRSRGGWLGGYGRGGEVKSSLVQNMHVSEDLQAKDREGNYTEAPIILAGEEVSYRSPVVDNGNSIHITTNSAAGLLNNSKRDLLNNTGIGSKAVRTKKRNLSGSYKRTKMATVSSGSVENSEFKQAASKVRYRSGSGGQPRRERRHVSEHQFKSRSGPAITVTINSDVEFPNEGKYFSAEHICSPSFQFQHRPEDIYNNYSTSTSIYATPKEDFSPAKEPASFNMAGSYLREQIISFLQPSDNKLAMKLFGNKKAVMKEKQRQSAAGNWIIHPCSSFRNENGSSHGNKCLACLCACVINAMCEFLCYYFAA